MSELDPKGLELAGSTYGKHSSHDANPYALREAITAYLSTVSPLSDGDGCVKALEAELLAAREALRLLLCIDFDRGTEHDETLLDDVLRQARALSGKGGGK